MDLLVDDKDVKDFKKFVIMDINKYIYKPNPLFYEDGSKVNDIYIKYIDIATISVRILTFA